MSRGLASLAPCLAALALFFSGCKGPPSSPPQASGCSSDDACAPRSGPCRVSRCREGTCTDEPRPAGALPPDDAPRDCRRPVCSEGGEAVLREDPTDVPEPDGNVCNRPFCDGGQRGWKWAPGASCGEGSRCRARSGCATPRRIAVGASKGCAWLSEGEVACWPVDPLGAAAAEEPEPSSVVATIASVKALTMDEQKLCWLDGEGGLRCTSFAFLAGTMSADDARGAMPAELAFDVAALAGAERTTCAIGRDRKLLCWDLATRRGQSMKRPPVWVAGGEAEKTLKGAPEALFAGNGRGCARLASGEIECVSTPWAGKERLDVAALARAPGGVKSLALSTGHACSLDGAGRVRCLGSNVWRESAPTSERTAVLEPALVEGLGEASAVVARDGQTCALERSGKVVCWGVPVEGEARTPTAVAGLEGAVEIALSSSALCARMGSGEVLCRPPTASGRGAEALARVVF